jgi:hypothetical protein
VDDLRPQASRQSSQFRKLRSRGGSPIESVNANAKSFDPPGICLVAGVIPNEDRRRELVSVQRAEKIEKLALAAARAELPYGVE